MRQRDTRPAREQTPVGSVYWMEGSRRRQALEWLDRPDLTSEERTALEAFVRHYRTNPRLDAGERRALLRSYDRIARRLARRASRARE